MPRLAAWVAVVWLGALAMAWAMFQGTWLLASWTAFKPTSIGFLAPVLAVATVLVIVALSRPCADLFTIAARKIDRLWQRRLPGTLLGPRTILIGAGATAIGAGYLIWILLVDPRLADRGVGVGFPIGPSVGIAVAIAVHLAWRGPRWVLAGGGTVVVAAAFGAIIAAVHVVHSRPATALAIWADGPAGRFAIEQLFELEDLRRELPLDDIRPVARADHHPDLVLITLDGVRADRTPPYGGSAPMPALRDLAIRGTLFRAAYATTPVGGRSLPSLITGVSANRLRGEDRDNVLELDPRHVTLAERLRAAGYATAGFVALDDPRSTWTRGLDHVTTDPDPARLGYLAREWITERERQPTTAPLFVWVHLRSANRRDAATLAARLATYDASLAALDGGLADVIKAFGGRPIDRAPIVIVTADRGEELGEHGSPYRADEVFEGLIHVPLIVAGPGVKPQTVTETESVADLVPTILDLAGYQSPRGPAIDGRSLIDLLSGKRRADSTVAPTGIAFVSVGPENRDRGPGATAVIRGAWKLIDNGSGVELYDLRADPDERISVAGQHMAIVSELRAQLAARQRAQARPPF